jgi:hypothetical protein
MKLKKIIENLMSVDQHSDPDEVPMAIADLKSMIHNAQQLLQYMEQNKPSSLEGWVQSKITKAADYIDALHKYFHFNPQQDGGCSSCGDELSEDKNKKSIKLTLSEPEVALAKKTPALSRMFSSEQLSNLKAGVNQLSVNHTIYSTLKQKYGNKVSDVTAQIQEAKSTCCGRCGHYHVKGTSCPKPYLTGKRHCRNRPR